MQNPLKWTWDEIHALPPASFEGDIHCVTTWSKLGVHFSGVSVDTLLGLAEPLSSVSFVLAFSHTGYTTNLPLADVTGGKAWVVLGLRGGSSLAVDHGGPARLLVPHLYFWKSAKWVAGLRLLDHDEPGFWELSTAITTGVTPGSSSGTRVTEPVTASMMPATSPSVAPVPAPGPWQGATVEEVRPGRRRGRRRFVSPAVAARAVPRRPALHRASHRSGRLHRLAPRIRVASAPDGSGRIELSGRASRGRRGVHVPGRGGHGRRRARGARADRRLLRLARRTRRPCSSAGDRASCP